MTEEKKENLEKSKSLISDTKAKDVSAENEDAKPSENEEMSLVAFQRAIIPPTRADCEAIGRE